MSNSNAVAQHRETSGRNLTRLTLPLGHVFDSVRAEVPDDVRSWLRDDVLPLLYRGGAVNVGTIETAVVGVGQEESRECMLRCTMLAPGGVVFAVGPERGPGLLSIGIGWADPGAAVVWQEVGGAQGEPTRPWCVDMTHREVAPIPWTG